MKTLLYGLSLFLFLLSAHPSKGDEAAEKLIADSARVAKTIPALTAHIDVTWQTAGQPLKRNVGTIKLMKPNYARITMTGDYPLLTLVSDGSFIYAVSDPTKYTVANVDSHGKNIDTPWWALPVRFFFTQSIHPFGADAEKWTSSRYVGFESIRGETCRVVEIAGEKPMAYIARLYFAPNRMLRRSVVTFGRGEGAAVFTAEIKGLKIARRRRLAEFKFIPPATAKLDTGAESRLLAVGDTAPDFDLPTPDGDTLALAKIREGKRATLVNFWYIACPPCREEFGLFEKLYMNLKEQGFAVVAINKVDEASEIKQYLRETNITFPIVIGERAGSGVFGSYRVETYPSTYLLDSEGKIVYRCVGVKEAELRQALQKLGLKP